MKSLIFLGVLISLISMTSYGQTRKVKKIRRVKTGKTTKKRTVVKKTKKVRIFRSAIDLLYIPKHHQFQVSTGVESLNMNYLRDYFFPPNGQIQQVFSEEIDEKRFRAFGQVNYAATKNLVVGARFANSFQNTIESANARNTGSVFTLYDEDNSGFDDPEIHGLYRILRQSKSGFTIDVIGSVSIPAQTAQKEEGDYEVNNTTWRSNLAPPSEALTQPGNPSKGGADVMLGIRAGRKHTRSFEYMLQADVTFRTARDYELRRAFAQTFNFYSDLEYEEDAQFSFHTGALGQFNASDVFAIYGGVDFYFNGQREINTIYPNASNERTDVDATSGFGARLGFKFQVVPHRFVLTLEGHYQQFANSDVVTFVNNIESFRYTTDDVQAFGGKLQADIFF